MAILCAARKSTVNGRLAVSIRRLLWSICSPSIIWRETCEDSLRRADVYRLGIHLPRRREKLFTRKWPFDPCRLARVLVPAATVSQLLQLGCPRARYYCSNHCGSDYEFYYCSKKSFGCCRIGVGYCDLDGLLRCHP